MTHHQVADLFATAAALVLDFDVAPISSKV